MKENVKGKINPKEKTRWRLKLKKKEKLNRKIMKKGNLEGKGMMKDITQLMMTTMNPLVNKDQLLRTMICFSRH
jgi:hypothetical protein